VNTNHLKVPGALACSVTPSTLLHLLTDLVDSLERQGVRKLVLLNGHGGNELKPLMRELHHRTKVFLCLCDWFRMAADVYPKIFDKIGEHADEVETSLGLAFFRPRRRALRSCQRFSGRRPQPCGTNRTSTEKLSCDGAARASRA